MNSHHRDPWRHVYPVRGVQGTECSEATCGDRQYLGLVAGRSPAAAQPYRDPAAKAALPSTEHSLLRCFYSCSVTRCTFLNSAFPRNIYPWCLRSCCCQRNAALRFLVSLDPSPSRRDRHGHPPSLSRERIPNPKCHLSPD